MKAKGQEAANDLLKSNCKTDFFSSFKAETNRIQWLHWLDILDQQTSNQGLGSLNLESDLDFKGNKPQEPSKLDSKTSKSSATKDPLDSGGKSGNMFGRGLQASGDKYSTLKFPEAMVAIAQAAKDLPGWPLMSNKMQMHKCEKCSQEFCSSLNQRRHMRAIHRRPLNGDKEDLKKKRDQIAAFWDKLSSEEASEIVSAKNLSLMDLSGMALVRALSTQLQQPSLLLLPQSYTKVASALLDLVQSKTTKMEIKSGELFAILEDASEKNMLYGVISSSMHRCVFDNDPVRVGLETKNMVASLGFLVEYRLVRAWMDDKDAEALRCQKALVEEEEAAQKRQAKLLERKKQRKLRLKECKDKERRSIDSTPCLQELKFDVFPREGEDSLTVTQSSPSSSASSGLDSHSIEAPPITNGESENAKFVMDNLEADQTFESPDDVEESFPRFSNHLHLQKVDTLHDSGGDRDGSSMGLSPRGMGWKERKQLDSPFFQNHGRQLYGKDRKHYDHQYGGHRLTRASYGVPGYDHFNPRYGHYREKMTTLKRQNVASGTGHTVWARKAPQTSAAVAELTENGEINICDGGDDFIRIVSTGQLERSENSDQFGSANLEKGLSRESSLSSDSATSQSSVSVSAKVGAEEQDSQETKTIPSSSLHQTSSMKGEPGGSAALVIGSFSIPLEHPLPGSRVDHSLESDFVSDLKIESMNSLPGGRVSSTAHEWVEGPQPSCMSSVEGSLDPRAGGPVPREDSSSAIKIVGSGVQNKSVIKVWRPVTPVERNGSLTGGLSLGEGERSNAAGSFSGQREETDTAALHQGPLRAGEDNQQPADPSLAPYFSELLSFLAQRWSKAMSSPDIVCHVELDDTDCDEKI